MTRVHSGKTTQAIVFSLGLALFAALAAPASRAESQIRLLRGQTVYVPAYSNVYYGDREAPWYLAVILSIRNTSPEHPVTVLSVGYYNSDGKLLTQYLNSETPLGPLASTRVIVKESDKSGGPGASFLVRWKSDKPVPEPVIETVMISTVTQQGISFTSRGHPIAESP